MEDQLGTAGTPDIEAPRDAQVAPTSVLRIAIVLEAATSVRPSEEDDRVVQL
jgi:hypothetical protein